MSYYSIFTIINLLIPVTAIILAFTKPIPASKTLLLLILLYALLAITSYLFTEYIIIGIKEILLGIMIPFIICFVKTKRFT